MKLTFFTPYQELFVDEIHNSQKHNMICQQYHDCYEIYYQIKGRRYFFFQENCIMAHAGDLIIIKPFTLHYSSSLDIDYYERIVLNFRFEWLDFMINERERKHLEQLLSNQICHLPSEQAAHVLSLMREILATQQNPASFFREKQTLALLFHFLAFLSQCLLPRQTEFFDTNFHPTVSGNTSSVTSLPVNAVSKEVISAIHYINEHYNKNLTLDEVAVSVHLSKYHFDRIFSKAVGSTFLQYLNNLRLSKVHQLLLDTNEPLFQIAERTGFSSTAHMNRQFHKNYQMSPREFRKKNCRKN